MKATKTPRPVPIATTPAPAVSRPAPPQPPPEPTPKHDTRPVYKKPQRALAPPTPRPEQPVRPPTRIAEVLMVVSTRMAVGIDELAARTRHPRVVWARAIIVHVARLYTTQSYPEIARAIGRPNHSTVVTAHFRLMHHLKLERGDKLRTVPMSGYDLDLEDLIGEIEGLLGVKAASHNRGNP